MNLGLSVSRVGSAAQEKAIKQVAGNIKLELAQYREMESFAQFGSDLDEATKKLLDKGRRLTELLKQPQFKPLSMAEQVVVFYAANKGYLNNVAIEQVSEYIEELVRIIVISSKSLVDAIESENKLTPDIEERLTRFLDGFSDKFRS